VEGGTYSPTAQGNAIASLEPTTQETCSTRKRERLPEEGEAAVGEGAPRPAGDGGADAEEHEGPSERRAASVEQSSMRCRRCGRGGGRESSERRREEWHLRQLFMCTRRRRKSACVTLLWAHESDSSSSLHSWALEGHFWASPIHSYLHGPECHDSPVLNPSPRTEASIPKPYARIGAASTSSANTSSSAASALRASLAMAEPEVEAAAAAAMETEAPAAAGQKREREETGDGAAEGGEEKAAAAEETAAAKKQKVEGESKGQKEGEEGKSVKLGPKEFASSVEMFDYFFALLHSWSPQLDFNKVRVRLQSSLIALCWSGYMNFLRLVRFAILAVALFAD
jgi:hypothetical protein